ncbi:MAG: DUF4097 family beta strand repeat-containing protein [Candidatus Acidiferrales bacterium]
MRTKSFSPAVPSRLPFFLSFLLLASLLLPASVVAAGEKKSAGSGPRVTLEVYGSVITHDGQRLRLVTDLGNVVIRTQASGKVDYHVHLEADASQKNAAQLLKSFVVNARETAEGVSFRGQTYGRQLRGRLWVTLEINVPKNYGLDVYTGGGNIETEDINGRIALTTAGGNILARNVGGAARLVTDGGHITVKNVGGELFANTGGGHITTGSVAGSASLHTNGGHIRVASVKGVARLDTGGGNITLEHSGGELVAETAGGQIEVGEAAGLVRAKTGGGGIRLVRVSGPTNLETGGGSIYLTQVDGAVRASTGTGGITAWFVSPSKQTDTCDLQSGDGDIVVYLPRQLAVTIDAQIQQGNEHHVIADPAFPLKMSYDDASNGSRRVRAEGDLNGGGEVLRLRAVAGNIRLVLSDSSKQVQIYRQQMEQIQQKLATQLRVVEQSLPEAHDRP